MTVPAALNEARAIRLASEIADRYGEDITGVGLEHANMAQAVAVARVKRRRRKEKKARGK